MNKAKLSVLLISVMLLVGFTVVVLPASADIDVIYVPEDYPTIQDAIDAANTRDTILVGPGEWYGGVVDKPVRIIGLRGAVIIDGVAYPYLPGQEDQPYHIGFFVEPEGSGSSISHFTFRGGQIGDTENYLYFGVFARSGTHEVTVTWNKISDCGQCISFHGDNWVIKYNTIEGYSESMGRVTGIFFGSTYTDYPSTGNIIAFNKIVAEVPGGSQWPSHGISIDTYQYGETTFNKVVFNKIQISGPDTNGIFLEPTWLSDDPTPEEITLAQSLIHDNIISFNNLRGCTVPFSINPIELEEVNTISHNLQ